LPPYQVSLFAQCPNASDTLTDCVACHDSPGGTLNPFGSVFLVNGLVPDATLEARDSDGDGATDGAKLAALRATNPGDPSSKPGSTAPVTPPPTTPTLPTASPTSSHNCTGVWWNPAESGWRINADHHRAIVFATLFPYDEAGITMRVLSSTVLQADGGTYGDPCRARDRGCATTHGLRAPARNRSRRSPRIGPARADDGRLTEPVISERRNCGCAAAAT
jgi:hypothetical protein